MRKLWEQKESNFLPMQVTWFTVMRSPLKHYSHLCEGTDLNHLLMFFRHPLLPKLASFTICTPRWNRTTTTAFGERHSTVKLPRCIKTKNPLRVLVQAGFCIYANATTWLFAWIHFYTKTNKTIRQDGTPKKGYEFSCGKFNNKYQFHIFILCRSRDLNPNAVKHPLLKRICLPISSLRLCGNKRNQTFIYGFVAHCSIRWTILPLGAWWDLNPQLQSSQPCVLPLNLQTPFVAPHGFEPRYAESKSAVLPLDEGAFCRGNRNRTCVLEVPNFADYQLSYAPFIYHLHNIPK